MANPKVTPQTTPTASHPGSRKPWKPKTPLDAMREQEAKIHKDVTELEEQLSTKRRELEKFQQALKVFETT